MRAPAARRSTRFVAASLLAAAAGLLPCAALALDPALAITQYSLRAWLSGEGPETLPQNSVFSVVQSREGYLWIATQEGLARFDGARFVVFNTKNTPQLRHNDVWKLLEDRAGSLWIATRGGGLTRLKDGEFTHYGKAEGLPDESVQALWEDQDGALWIGTQGSGLVRFAEGRFTALTSKDGLPADTIYTIAGDHDGGIWIGTDGGGAARYFHGKFTVLNMQRGLSHNTVYAIHQDAAGDLWIGTGAGLNRLHGDTVTVYRAKDGLSNENIRTLAEDRDGNLWIGTDGGGLDRYKDGRFAAFTSKDGLSNDSVGALYEDREGSLWIGTDAGGLDRLKDSRFVSYTTREGLSDDNARAILEDRDGGLWVGTFGGLNRFKDGHWTALTSKNSGLSKDVVLSLLQDRAGDVWAGTLGGGLNRLHPGKPGGKFTVYSTAQGLSNETVLSMLEDRNGVLWFGTRSGGLNRFEHGAFKALTTKDGLSSNDIRALLESSDGSVWAGTRGGGLDRIKDGKVTAYTAKDGLSSDLVFALHEDADGVLWAGTFGGGLNRFKDGRFKAITAKDGLFDDVVFRILEDASGNLWMSSNRGVFRVSRKELNAFADGTATAVHSIVYGAADGMKSAEANGAHQPAGWKTRDGRLWFPTIRGVAAIDPARIRTNLLPPPVTIEELRVDGTAAPLTGNVEVPPGSRSLEFRYTAFSLLVPERVQFRYRLEGFDEGWVDAGTRRIALYTNIPPGTYRFRVMASNNDGVWNETGAELAFSLQPYFYQRRAFYLVYAMAVALALLAGLRFHRGRVRQLQARERELVTLVNERRQAENALRTANTVLERRVAELSRSPASLAAATAPAGPPAAATGDDVNRLVGQFNEMLGQLAARERELQQARDALAHEVADKTRANQELEQTLRRLTETQAQLVQSEKLASLGSLVAGIAHEINTPIGVSVTAASTLDLRAGHVLQQLAANALAPEELRQFTALARDSSQVLLANLQRASDLVRSFKQVAVDQASGERRYFFVRQYIDEIITSLGPSLGATPHAVTIDCPAALAIDSYPGALAQILSNLINNSLVHAFPPGRAGKIHIAVREEPHGLLLRYSDDGVGIAREHLERIYEPFFTTRRGAGGSGLGMHIVYTLVTQRLGGTIEASSRPGEGVAFEMRFPLEARKAA